MPPNRYHLAYRHPSLWYINVCCERLHLPRSSALIFKAILRVVGGKLESGNWHHQLIKGRVKLKGAKRLGCLIWLKLALAAVLEVINCFLTVEAAINPTPALPLPVMKPTILIPHWPFQHRNVSIFQCRISSDNMCQ